LDLINSFNKSVKFTLINRKPKSYGVFWSLKLINSIFFKKNRIIHCHNYSLIYVVWIFFRTPKFLTIHGFDTKIKKHRLFDRIVCVSPALSDYVKNSFNLEVMTIFNGVDNRLIKVKNKFNHTIKLLFVGRFDDDIKGVDILIKAVNIIVNLGIDIHLTIIGKGSKQASYIQYIESNGLNNHVFFKGLVDRTTVYNLLSDYDISVIPSRKESFSLFAVESMMAKVPIIVSNIPGLSEVSGNHSFKFESENADDLAQCIISAITEIKNMKILSRTEKSFNHAVTNYNINLMIKNYDNLYNSL
jgi:glycosyltransferase involved in cell wall biosynthesis